MDIYLWRQILILSTGLLYSISMGLMMTLRYTIFITARTLAKAKTPPEDPNIRSHINYSEALDGLAGLLGSIILSLILQKGGRKPVHIALNLLLFTGYVTYLRSKNIIPVMYIGRLFHHMTFVGFFMNSIIISEYVPPNRRGYFISLQRVFIAIGILWGQLVSEWYTLCINGAVLSFLAIILTFIWPESPPYLALKMKDEKCVKAFEWLHGDSTESQRLLKELLDSQKAKRELDKKKRNILVAYVLKCCDKNFIKPFWVVAALILMKDVSIRSDVVVIEDRTLFSLYRKVLTVITILALVLSSVLIARYRRRSLMLFCALVNAGVIFITGLICFFQTQYFVAPTVWILALLSLFHCFVAYIGVLPLSFVLIGELFPIEDRGLGTYISGVLYTAIYIMFAKLAQFFYSHEQMHLMFALNGAVLLFCLWFVYSLTPETKDKSLQEIEKDMKCRSDDGDVIALT